MPGEIPEIIPRKKRGASEPWLVEQKLLDLRAQIQAQKREISVDEAVAHRRDRLVFRIFTTDRTGVTGSAWVCLQVTQASDDRFVAMIPRRKS
jgi:hypothetical protein